MQNAGQDKPQAGIKTAGRNFNNLRYADDTILGRKWRGTKEPLDEGERGEWKGWLETRHSNENHGKNHGPISLWQIEGEKVKAVTNFLFLGSQITANGDCSHEIRQCLLLGRKAMTNLDSIFKSRDITLPTKVSLVKAMVFPVVMYGNESWTIKKVEHQRTDAFELWSWRRLLRVPWTAKRSNQSTVKDISPEYSLEGLSWSWSSNTLATWCKELTQWKRPWCWERLNAIGEGGGRVWEG